MQEVLASSSLQPLSIGPFGAFDRPRGPRRGILLGNRARSETWLYRRARSASGRAAARGSAAHTGHRLRGDRVESNEASQGQEGERASAAPGHDSRQVRYSHSEIWFFRPGQVTGAAYRISSQANRPHTRPLRLREDRDHYNKRQCLVIDRGLARTLFPFSASPMSLPSRRSRFSLSVPRAQARHCRSQRARCRRSSGGATGYVAAQKKVPSRAKNAYLVLTRASRLTLGPTMP